MSADHENDMTPHGMADFGGAEPRMQGPVNSGTETSSSDLEKAWGRATERLRRDPELLRDSEGIRARLGCVEEWSDGGGARLRSTS